MPFQTHADAIAEFKKLNLGKEKGAKEFSSRVQCLEDVVNVNIGAQAKDDSTREQFIDGLFDVELQVQLLSP